MAKIGDAGRLRCSGCGALVGPPIELRLETVSTAEVFLYVPVRVSVEGSWEGRALFVEPEEQRRIDRVRAEYAARQASRMRR